jgi:hypothetical protein
MEMTRSFSTFIRSGIIEVANSSTGYATVHFNDSNSDDTKIIQYPHPYAGPNGEGIFVGIPPKTEVMLGMKTGEYYVPVCVVPRRNNFGIDSSNGQKYECVKYPNLASGEIAIQGMFGSILKFDVDGDIRLQNSFKEGFVISNNSESSRCLMHFSLPTEYRIAEDGIFVNGFIRRDLRLNSNLIDSLNSCSDTSLEEVGWDPSKPTSILSNETASSANQNQTTQIRNPAFVENRQIIYEFGRGYNVGTIEEENKRINDKDYNWPDNNDRRNRKSNLLSLSLSYPNELIEKVEGTLVDIFGNILDINKNIIPLPKYKTGEDFLKQVSENLRHSVALHMEINTRKGFFFSGNQIKDPVKDPMPSIDSSANNARDRSRWSFRVDKEGLTVVNIPATSETGNIPFLARAETTSVLDVSADGENIKGHRKLEDTKDLYPNVKDIFLDQVGPGGITVKGVEVTNRLKDKPTSWVEEKQITFDGYLNYGTAFHDITSTAKILLENTFNIPSYKLKDYAMPPVPPLPAPDKDPLAVSKEIEISFKDDGSIQNANAGGRSLQLSLDGSLETSIGANTIDRVSWTLDTAGALIARLGRDKNGRSAVVQTDGSIALEIGGWDFVGTDTEDSVDTRFVGDGIDRANSLLKDQKRFRGGKLVIRVRRSAPDADVDGPDAALDDHFVIIDDSGISIQSAGTMEFISKQSMIFKSNASIALDAPTVQLYSGAMTRYVRRKTGKHI